MNNQIFFTLFATSWRSDATPKIQNDTIATFIWSHLARELGTRPTIAQVDCPSNVLHVRERKYPKKDFSPRCKKPTKKIFKKCNHCRPFQIVSFSLVKRVVGSPFNFQTVVSTYTVLVCWLRWRKKFTLKNEKLRNRNQTKTERKTVVFIFVSPFKRYACSTDMEIDKKKTFDFIHDLRLIKTNNERYLHYAQDPSVW